MLCPHCGAEADEHAVYCPSCHRNLGQKAQPEDAQTKSSPILRRGELFGVIGVFGAVLAGSIYLYAIRAAAPPIDPSPADTKLCLSNIKQLATATEIYTFDHSGHYFPDPVKHRQALKKYVKLGGIYDCPTTGTGFVANPAIAGKHKTALTAKTVLYFEGPDKTAAFPHGPFGNVAFVDTSARRVAKGTTLKY